MLSHLSSPPPLRFCWSSLISIVTPQTHAVKNKGGGLRLNHQQSLQAQLDGTVLTEARRKQRAWHTYLIIALLQRAKKERRREWFGFNRKRVVTRRAISSFVGWLGEGELVFLGNVLKCARYQSIGIQGKLVLWDHMSSQEFISPWTYRILWHLLADRSYQIPATRCGKC